MADSWYCLLFQPTIAEIEKTMFDRGNEIQRIKENMNNVEDKVFANFCEQIGVANIRQYEERELRYCLWLQYLLLDKSLFFFQKHGRTTFSSSNVDSSFFIIHYLPCIIW